MTSSLEQHALLDLLAARQGHFRYESGHHGDLWLNLDLLFLRPRQLQPFVASLAQQLKTYPAAAVCGPLLGGALLAQTIAAELDLEFYCTERVVLAEPTGLYPVAYRLPQELGLLLRDKDVVIVDDVINAGSAVRATVTALREWGARPVAIAALLVLGTTVDYFFAQQQIPVESIARRPSNLWEPAACPLCAAHRPIDNC